MILQKRMNLCCKNNMYSRTTKICQKYLKMYVVYSYIQYTYHSKNTQLIYS